ncbi:MULTISPECIES: flagellar basal body-associated FliL family protein [Thiomicrorhabdus]|uniref:Flagellar protein FliL n=1 Tax=Thiomicrorhabdus heinhorstiae TaxID=2748010 RepID=A0ABS0BX55_9GAMM|nr:MULTISPECIES: flagellar basal body-associated FliL family protein [Thiomicrorhabdus]MBF6058372.1 flagellar basal body-associated FliL family protein [Thiomicrorhabdus heinhorstiae]
MAEEVQEPKKSGKGLMIVLIVIVFLLLVGIGVLVYLLMGPKDDGGHQEDQAVAEQHVEEGHALSYSPKYKQFDPPEAGAPPQYFTMDKFVVNFNGDGQAKYLAVDLKFLSYYPQLVGPEGDMEHLRPILKNDIQRLLRNQHYNQLSTPDGPDKLREEILQVTRQVLEKHNIYPDLVEDVYMTRFVMQ